ncbi:MAG: tetratricopeptide repeat protein, partial [Bacteroidota bacterium]
IVFPLLSPPSTLARMSRNTIPELMNNPFLKFEAGGWIPFSTGEWSASVVYGLGQYLKLLFIPYPLSHDYYPRAFEIMNWGDWRVILSFLINLGLVVFAFLHIRKRPWLAAGIFIYFTTLSIASNVFFPIGTLLSERFLFFPSVGLSLAILGYFTGAKPKGNRRVGAYITLGIIALFAGLTILRNPVWKDNFTLFTTDVHVQPNSAKLQNAAAGAKIDRYITLPEARQATNKSLLTEAIIHLNEATRIHPTYKAAYLLRGTANMLLDQYDPAIADLDNALQLDPGYEAAMEKLRIALQRGGRYYGEQQGNFNKSKSLLERALSLDPNNYETLRLLGVLNGVSGQKAQALNFFKRATQVKPDDTDALWNLGTAYLQNSQPDLAQEQFSRARQIEPGIDARKQRGE